VHFLPPSRFQDFFRSVTEKCSSANMKFPNIYENDRAVAGDTYITAEGTQHSPVVQSTDNVRTKTRGNPAAKLKMDLLWNSLLLASGNSVEAICLRSGAISVRTRLHVWMSGGNCFVRCIHCLPSLVLLWGAGTVFYGQRKRNCI
jgi:hypothetical protein